MMINYPEIGICGLSCRLCPMYHTRTKSRCFGCKSKVRMAVGCLFITCAIKRKEIEFCWECKENEGCEKWRKHREAGERFDSFKCYQKLEDNIAFIQKNGIKEFEKVQRIREKLLKEVLENFDEGRSKTYYCIAATVMELEDLRKTLNEAKKRSTGLRIREKSKMLHLMLNDVANKKSYHLKLRKRQ